MSWFLFQSFLGAFAKLPKATISFIMSVCPTFSLENRAVMRQCGRMWHSQRGPRRRMRFECWITKATETHSEYKILIAFPEPKWLQECASMLRLHLYFLSCLVHLLSYKAERGI